MSSLTIDQIRAKYGDATADAVDKVTQDPAFATTLIDANGPTPNTDQALALLGQIFARKVPLAGAAEALATITTALVATAGLKMVSAQSGAVSRPREDGLPEAMTQAVKLKQKHAFMLSAFPVDPAAWTGRTERITMLRSWLGVGQDFTRAVVWALGNEENGAEKDLRASFGVVRPVVLQNVPEKEHEDISDYLYGSAAQAAQRSKENQAHQQAMTAKAQSEVTLTARQEARAEVTKDLTAMVQELGVTPAAPAAAPAAPVASPIATAVAAAHHKGKAK